MFDFRALDITDDDISFVEDHFGFKFNDGQKKVIRYLDSTDIQACPGSGKTTTLAAKLIILARKIPKSFKQGVCIITHTNVAVEEIKNKLGVYSNFYSSYPNHFGTIQSVVDKYFTIPAFKNEFKTSPIIGDDSYFEMINKIKSREIEAAKIYLSRSKNIDFLGTLSFNKTNLDIARDINEAEPIVGKHTPTYNTLFNLKLEILKRGYIKYDEAYSISFKYIRENPAIKDIFNKRFPLVFIDEMQDMESHQVEFLFTFYQRNEVIIQKIGDINQSIYNYSTLDIEQKWKPSAKADLQLTETKRISDNIVQAVKEICVVPQEMTGWTNQIPLNPTIILFDDKSIHSVKNKFGELLIHNNLHKGKPCKAIGQRLGESRLNINSYWYDFNRGYNKNDYSNIISFLEYAKQLSRKSKNVKEIRKVLLSIICKCLRLCKVKNPESAFYFTPYTLSNYFNSLDDLNLLNKLNNYLSKWVVSILNTEIISREIESFVIELLPIFDGQAHVDLKQFFTNSEVELVDEKEENKTYHFSKNGEHVQIHFDTIHGVKGETHTATLYMETYNRVYDIGSKILEFLIGNEKQRNRYRTDNAFKRRLPLAYVAMTRATHFLCLAVHKDRFTEKHRSFFENNPNWDIISI